MALFQKKQTEQDIPARRQVRVQRPSVQSLGTYSSKRQTPEEGRSRRPQEQVRQVRRLDDDMGRGEAQATRGKLLKVTIRKRRIMIALGAGAVVLFILSLIGLTGSPSVVVKQNTANVPTLHSQEEYEQEASALIAKTFANRNKITFDRSAVESGMLARFPELLTVTIELPLIGFSPVVTLQPSPPAAVLQTNSSGTFIIDSSGFAISSDSSVSGMDLPLVLDQTGLVIRAGERAVPSTTMNLITKLSYQLSKKEIVVESYVLPAQSAYEVNVRMSGVSYFAKLSTEDSGSFDQQIGSLLALREYLTDKRITPGEYVDVRIVGRAYYK